MTYTDDNNYRKPFIYAFALHIIVFIALIAHFKFPPKPSPVLHNSVSIIKAVAVTPNQLQNQLAKLQAAQQAQLHEQQAQQQQQNQQQQQKIAQQAQAEAIQAIQQKLIQQQQDAAKAVQVKAAQLMAAQQAQEKLAEEKAAEQAAQQKQEQAKNAAALKAQQLKAIQEQKRLAQLAIQQALQQQEQPAAHAKPTQDRQKQMQTAKLAQQLLQQQLAATDDTTPTSATSAALSAAAQGQVDKFSALIIQAIGQQWIIPDGAQKDLQGKMQVKIAPGGMVLNVAITQSSGNAAFDRSARAAVFKASPLPVPKDSTVFNQFRELNLTFKPAGISNS